jgi:glutathione S-transferase
MQLFGTTTSPFVRRVRVVAAELGIPYELVSTATDEGMARMRAVSPLWKVPVAVVQGRTLWDSRTIIDWMTAKAGMGPLHVPADRWGALNQLNAVDAALESAIAVFYLGREGIDVSGVPFGIKQRQRIDSILAWLAGCARTGDFGGALGLAEISLVCAMDWFDFRAAHPTDAHPELLAIRERLRERPSLRDTRPHA